MTVVVVEDSRRMVDLYVDMLGALGHSAQPFFDSQSFLGALPTLRADLLILDRRLPGGDGVEVAHRVRALRPELPILMISGNPPAPTAALDRVLAKPCTVGQFTEAVSDLLAPSRRRAGASPDDASG